ncbi:bifunctional P-loop containing nucleoside triphosphate hydrolase/GTP binding domain [Babesia duncani]|uniref:Bifunctional P-loop containing nucleoside triphosphate hydrolase/GTP binding domain n=1 Tax=Babesia duncani TaxID=323732 RepID=A0AAD9PIV1_9APIC|nr:bifunctional P-loop containing nucleoside triphosphate hydrolase/GTP binding domain [Babesia duncani]
MGITKLLLKYIVFTNVAYSNRNIRHGKCAGFNFLSTPRHVGNFTSSPNQQLQSLNILDIEREFDEYNQDDYNLLNIDRGLDVKVGANSSIYRKDLELRKSQSTKALNEDSVPFEDPEPWDLDSDDEEFPKVPNYDDLTEADILKSNERIKLEESGGMNPLDYLVKKKEQLDKEQLDKERMEGKANAWKALVQKFEVDASIQQCAGCGVNLQFGNQDVKGFIELPVLQMLRQTKTIVRCKRCSNMRSGLIFKSDGVALCKSAVEAARETVSILRNALSIKSKSNVSIVYVMDVLDMHFEQGLAELIIARRKKRTGNTLFYIALNKMDLLPRHNRIRILRYVHKMITTRAPELKLKPRHIFLMSSKNRSGVNLFQSVLLDTAYKLKSNIILVGPTNAGKSTFLNCLSNVASFKIPKRSKIVKSTMDNKDNLLSTSVIPGTTLSPLRIDIAPGLRLYDTPGIIVPHSLTSHLTAAELKVAVTATIGLCRPIRIGPGENEILASMQDIHYS